VRFYEERGVLVSLDGDQPPEAVFGQLQTLIPQKGEG
jgi:hypothetical protein